MHDEAGVSGDELISLRLPVVAQRDHASDRLAVQADAGAGGGLETNGVVDAHERSELSGRGRGQEDVVACGAAGGVRAGVELVQAGDRDPLAPVVALVFRPPFFGGGYGGLRGRY